MTHLSVNINKIATLRNARGGTHPSVKQAAVKCQEYGAEGITIHPRPDERHITQKDVYELKPIISTEFNIEGNPQIEFLELVLKVKPEQVTFVPDTENVITSNSGWNCKKHLSFLQEVVAECKKSNIRTSIFLDPNPKMVEYAAKTGADRIELYTEEYAKQFEKGNLEGIKPYKETAKIATSYGLGINAGHDLNLQNTQYLIEEIPEILEVSIGHALISESIYMGLENTIQAYLKRIKL